MSFDAARARADVALLAFPRRTGGPGEARARAVVVRRLQDLGLEPHVESFTFSPLLMDVVLPLFLLATAGVVLAAGATYNRSAGAALALLVLAFLGGLPATRWGRAAEWLLDVGPRRPSANIVAALPDPPNADRHLVLMAHYDSKSQALPIWGRAAAALGVLVGGLLLLLSAAAAVLTGRGSPFGVLVFGGSVLCALGLVTLALNPWGDRSPGALDNAAGVAVLLEAARALAGEGLQRTRLTLVATGAEEEGMAGAVRFLQAHAHALGRRVCFINLDSPGGDGTLAALSAFGIPPIESGRDLRRAVHRLGSAMGIRIRSVYLPAGVGTDHFPAAARGIPAITLSSLGPGLRRIHSPRDTPSLVTEAGLAEAGRLTLALVRQVDAAEDGHLR